MKMKNGHRPAQKQTVQPEPVDAINRHLGGRVKQLRAARGWSLDALANASGVSRSMPPTYPYRSDKDCIIRTLCPLNLEKDVEFYEVRLQPGGALRSSPHFEGTREFLTVQKGRLRIESANDAEELTLGDSASYRADVPHALINVGKTEAIIYLIVIYR